MKTITINSQGDEKLEMHRHDASICVSATAVWEQQHPAGNAAEFAKSQDEDRRAEETQRWWGINE